MVAGWSLRLARIAAAIVIGCGGTMSFRNSEHAQARASRVRLFAGVSIVALAAMIGGEASAAPDPLTTVHNQARLDDLVVAGEIERLAGTALVLDNGGPVRFSDSMTLEGVAWGNGLKAYFAKDGAGVLTLDGASITGGEVHIREGTIDFTGANEMYYVSLGSGGSGDATMTIGGGSVTFGVGLQVGDFGGTGRVHQTGGTVTVKEDCELPTSCGSLNIGNQGGTGEYKIDGGELNLVGGTHSIGRNTGSNAAGSGTLLINGGLVSLSRDTDSGFSNPGDLIIGDRDEGGNNGEEASGSIVQTGGTLRIGADSHLFLGGYGDSSYELSGGTLEIGGNSLSGNYLTSTGNYAFNLGGGTIKVIGSDLNTNVDAELIDETLSTFDTNGFNANWTGSLTGTGSLAKDGVGTLTIGNLATTIETLVVNKGHVDLTGPKDFSGETTLAVIAGSTLNVGGDFTLGSSGEFVVGINDAGQSGMITATGDLAINGTVRVVPVDGYLLDSGYEIAKSTGGTASFANAVAEEDFAFLSANLTLAGTNSILLTLTQDANFATGAVTANQAAAANGIESVRSGDLFDAIQFLSTADAPAAFDAISGEIHAAATTTLLNDSFFLRDAVLGRLQYPTQGSAAPSVSLASGYAEGDKRSAAPFPGAATTPAVEANTFWSQAYGSWGHSDGNSNVAKLDRSTGGILVGYDRSFGQDWLIGAAAGYSRTSFDLDDRASSGDSDNYHLLAYAGGTFSAVNVRLGASYSWNEIDTTRNVALPGFFEQEKADYSAGTTQLFGELSHDFAVSAATTLSPFAGLAYVHLSTDGFGETGGSAALDVDGSNQSVTYGTLGLRADHKIAVGNTAVTLQGAAGWQHAWGDVTPTSTLAFSGGDAFQVTGAPIARDALLLKAGFDVDITQGAKLGLFYVGQLASDAADNSIQGRLSVAF